MFFEHIMAFTLRLIQNSSNFSYMLKNNRILDTKVLTIHKLMAYLKMAEKTFYHLSVQCKIISLKVGVFWRFRKSEIDKWIVKQEK